MGRMSSRRWSICALRWLCALDKFSRRFVRTRGLRSHVRVYGLSEEAVKSVQHAILHLEQALMVRSLGYAYTVMPHGDSSLNTARAVQHYAQALAVFRREAYPVDWAETTNEVIRVQYSERKASAALECVFELEAALADMQHFSIDLHEFVPLVIASGGQRAGIDM